MTAAELIRADQSWIAESVPTGSRVLDLGCGDGRLLAKLRDERGCTVRGVEIDEESVVAAIARGISVARFDLDEGLGMYRDGSFDVVILSQTLQVVRRPAFLLAEMMRVGGVCLVSYPNFAHWKVRAYLALRGRMPVSDQIPYTWYETPNIHHTTILDFRDLVSDLGGTLEREVVLRESSPGHLKRVRRFPTLRGETVVVLLRK